MLPSKEVWGSARRRRGEEVIRTPGCLQTPKQRFALPSSVMDGRESLMAGVRKDNHLASEGPSAAAPDSLM